MKYGSIVCLDDLLRQDFWPAKEFIYDLARMPIFVASGLNIRKGARFGAKSNLKPGFDLDVFLRRCGDRSDWESGYHQIPAGAASYLLSHLPEDALVLSYEMPPWLRRVLDAAGRAWVDLRISPLRFGSDLYIALASSDPAIHAAAHAHSVPANEIAAEAALLAARLRYRLRYEPTTGAMDQHTVWIGQTARDASLFKPGGGFARVHEHADTLRRLAATGPLLYKAHPLAGAFAKEERNEIERIVNKRVALCEMDTYELLARDDALAVIGLSSGVLQEAAWFGRQACALHTPVCAPHFDATHNPDGYLQIASHVFLSQPLWEAVLGCEGQRPALVMPPRANHLRELHDTWWGYASATLRHNKAQREAFALAGGTRLTDSLRRCEGELAQARAEIAQLKAQIGQAPAATAMPAHADAATDARIDTLRMEVEGLKEALRVMLRQNAQRALVDAAATADA